MEPMRPIYRPSLREVLQFLLDLEDREFSVFQKAAQERTAFDADEARCAQIADAVGSDRATVTIVMTVLGYLYTQLHSEPRGSGFDQGVVELISQAGSFSEPASEKLQTRLHTLLRRNEIADVAQKVQRLKEG